jgi:hypothetical protein
MSELLLNLADVNARPRRCARCGCLFAFVEPGSAAKKRELQDIAFRGETMRFMDRLEKLADCHRGSAKAVFAHIVTSRGVCRRCRKQIPVVEYSDCPNCKSFNIWWGDAT